MSNKQPCAVCTEPGTLRCSRCRSMFFCGSEHQALLWSSHKLLCTPNAPLVFKQRPLAFAEILAWGDTRDNFLTRGEDGENSMSKQEVASRLASLLAEVPLAEQILLSSDVLSGNFCHAFKPSSNTKPKVEAFTLFSALAKIILCYTEFTKESGPFDVFAPLDDETRNNFQLQALVLCTLVEKRATADQITLAAERLLPIIAGHEREGIYKSGIADFLGSFNDWEERYRR
ncbi:hypothetical protein RQP46_003264 [Phenoliferia psychrophenolica]